MRTSDKLWTLISGLRYREAIEIGSAALTNEKENAADIWGFLSLAYFAVGDYSNALSCSTLRDELERKLSPFGMRNLHSMAVAAWLSEKKDLALIHAAEDVAALASGKRKYADAAGGVSSALFLYFCGVRLADTKAQAKAEAFLGKLARNSQKIRNWPGPLGLHYLNRWNRDQVLVQVAGTSDLDDAQQRADENKLLRRQLIETLFYFAVKPRAAGEPLDATALLRRCVSLQNPHVQLEWYLARKELQGM